MCAPGMFAMETRTEFADLLVVFFKKLFKNIYFLDAIIFIGSSINPSGAEKSSH